MNDCYELYIKKKLTQRVKLNLYKFIHFQKKQIKWDRFILFKICNLPDIFMSPWANFLFGSKQSELQAVPAITHSHSQHWYDVSAESLLQKKKQKQNNTLYQYPQKNWDNAILKWKVHLRGNSWMLPLSHHPLFSHGLLSMNHSVAVGTSVALVQRSLM